MNQKEMAREPIPEENVYSGVYRVLLVGMFISTAFFIIGVALALLHPVVIPLTASWIKSQYDFHVFSKGLIHGSPAAYMMLATILLILTPVMRVAVSIYAFFVDRDYKFVLVTAIVFFVIILTVVLSFFGLK